MLLKPAVIDRSHPLDVHQQSTQPIVPTTACPNAHTISHNNQPNFTLNPLLTNSLSMSLLIPSIVHPNPIQPPNNRPFRWIKSVKRSLPKQPLILQFVLGQSVTSEQIIYPRENASNSSKNWRREGRNGWSIERRGAIQRVLVSPRF